MKKKSFWINFVILAVAATLIHFLYEYTQFPPFKIISPISESVWEHSKLLVTPFLVFFIIYIVCAKPIDKLNYWGSAAKDSIVVQVTMIVIYYTYSGVLGGGNLVCDIILTYACVFIALLIFYKSLDTVIVFPWLWILLFIAQWAAVIAFTFWQPAIAIFQAN